MVSRSQGDREKNAPEQVLHPPLDWVLEAVILFGLGILFRPWLESWANEYRIDFHASIFWIPVLLLAIQHGLGGGLAAALIASALHLIDSASGVEVGETVVAYSLRLGFEPLAWTAAAALFGTMRTRASEAENRLRTSLATETRTVEIMAERYLRLRHRVESLERAMATGTTPALRRAQLLDSIGELEAPAMLYRLYEVLTAAANGARVTLYGVLHNDRVLIPPHLTSVTGTYELPPAAIFPVRDGSGVTLIEVHLERLDPDLFTQTDEAHFMELCDHIGSLLSERSVIELMRLARSRRPVRAS